MSFFLKRESIYFFLLLLVLISATIGYKLNGLSIIILGAFFLFDKGLLQKVKSIKTKIPFLFFGYFILYIIGYFYSENKATAGLEIEARISFLALPLILFSEKISKKNVYRVFVYFKYWLLIFAIFLIGFKLITVGLPLSSLATYSLSYLTDIHHAYFSLFYVFAICFTIHQFKNVAENKILLYCQIGFFLFFISILGARVTSLFALILVVLFICKQIYIVKGYKKYIIIFGFIVVGFFVYQETVFAEKVSRLTKVEWNIDKNIYNHQVFSFEYDDKTSNTLELRLIKWYAAFQIFKQNPIFGVGSGDYLDALESEYYKINFKKGIVYKYNTHNQFIEEFVKFGCFGGLFFLIFIISLFIDSLRKKNYLQFQILTSIILFLLVESAFTRQHGVVFFTFFIPILYIYHQKTNQ